MPDIFDNSQSDFVFGLDTLTGLEDIDQLRRAFANVLAHRRSRMRWSQVDLAAFTGLEHSYISRLEKGVRTPSLDVMVRLAKAFTISPERLVREVMIELRRLQNLPR